MKTLEAKPFDQMPENAGKRENRLFYRPCSRSAPRGKIESVRTHSEVIEQFDSFSLLKLLFLVRNWHCRCHRKFCSWEILQLLYNFLGNYAARRHNFLGNYAARRHNFLGNYAAARKFCRSSSARQTSFFLAFLSLDKSGNLHRAKIQVWWGLSSSFRGGECHPESRTRSARLSFRRDLTSSQRHFCHAIRCFGKFCLPGSLSPSTKKKLISREDRAFSSLDLVRKIFFLRQPAMVFRFKKQTDRAVAGSRPLYIRTLTSIHWFHQFWSIETSDTTSGDIKRWSQ